MLYDSMREVLASSSPSTFAAVDPLFFERIEILVVDNAAGVVGPQTHLRAQPVFVVAFARNWVGST